MFFWDLDGPILDVAEKYYRVYSDIMIDAGYETLGKKEYWNAKREGTSETEILKRTGAEAFYNKYHKKRLSLIESDYYLSLDRLQEGVIQTLEKVSEKYRLVLVTLRKSSSQLNKQLSDLDLEKYFSHVLSSEKDIEPRWKIKYNLIIEYLGSEYNLPHILIGDTEADIRAGNELRFKTIAVLNGIRTKKLLLRSNPVCICKSVEELLNPESIDIIWETN